MKLGKVSNTVFDRSVFKRLTKRGCLNVNKPLAGQEAHIINDTVVSQATGRFPVYKVANYIAAQRGKLQAVSCVTMLDERSREIRLREIVDELERQCSQVGVPILSMNSTVSNSVNKPVTSVTGIGKTGDALSKAKAGQEIIMVGSIGLSGIRAIVEAKTDEILKLYSKDVIDKALGGEEELLTVKASECFSRIDKEGVMYAASEGGITAALWNMAELSGVGLDVDFRSIPVKQEIVEICEIFNVNPYILESLGCLLMTSFDGCDIINKMSANCIDATIIGKVTDGSIRVLHNLDEDRFLNLPEQDEIYKFL